MGYGVSLPASTRTEALTNSTTTAGAQLTGGTGAYGSLVSLGTTGFDYDSIILQCCNITGAANKITLTTNTGGADTVFVADVFFQNNVANLGMNAVTIPVGVPKGSTIKAKSFCSTNAGTCTVAVIGIQGDARTTRGFRGLICLTDQTGFGSSNLLTYTGTSLTGWATIGASSANRIGGMIATIANTGSVNTNGHRIDIGWGAAASERVFTSMYFRQNGYAPNFMIPLIPCDFPAATRFAMRGLASAADVTQTAVFLYGLVA